MNHLQSAVILLSAAIGFLYSTFASAQTPELVELISQEAVHLDLGLARESPEVMKLVQISADLSRELMSARQLTAEQRAELDKLKGAERGSRLAEINSQKDFQGIRDKYLLQVKQTLSPEQFERLQQIRWHLRGSLELIEPDLAMTLSLSGEQRLRIQLVNRSYADKGNPQELIATDTQARVKRTQELTNERNAKALELLTEEQRKTYAKLIGKPFIPTGRFQTLPLSLGNQPPREPRAAPNPKE